VNVRRYVVWGGGSSGPEDDFFNSGVGIPTRRDNFLVEDRTAQCRPNAQEERGCSVHAAG